MTDKIKLLIADDNESIRKSMVDYFQQSADIQVVGTASNGADAYEATQSGRPDIVVLDLVMPLHDGFWYLEKMAAEYEAEKPNVIVLSAMGKDDCIARAMDMGACFYMLKPFDCAVLDQRVHMLMGTGCDRSAQRQRSAPLPTGTNALNTQINEMFLSIGIPSHVQGYVFLKEAVRLVVADRDAIHYITKELYPSIAKQFNTTPSKVERSIRHAISITWHRNDQEHFRKQLGIPTSNITRKPSNGEFIAVIAEKIRLSTSA